MDNVYCNFLKKVEHLTVAASFLSFLCSNWKLNFPHVEQVVLRDSNAAYVQVYNIFDIWQG